MAPVVQRDERHASALEPTRQGVDPQLPVLVVREGPVEAAGGPEQFGPRKGGEADRVAVEQPIRVVVRETHDAGHVAEELHEAEREPERRVCVQRDPQSRERVRRQAVVGIEHQPVGRVHAAQTGISCGADALIVLPHDSHALALERREHCLNVRLGGAIVHDDDPRGATGLPQQAVDRLGQEACVVVVGDDRGDVAVAAHVEGGLATGWRGADAAESSSVSRMRRTWAAQL